MQLGGEHKLRIDRDFAHPKLHQLRLDVSIKRSVDLHHIKALRQKFQPMLFAPRHSRRIENSLPILVSPSGRANANLARCVHGNVRAISSLQVSTASIGASVLLCSLQDERHPINAVGIAVRASVASSNRESAHPAIVDSSRGLCWQRLRLLGGVTKNVGSANGYRF